MNWVARALLIGSALAPIGLRAQAPRPAMVVQIAGTNLYVNVGSDAGLRAGDTLAVRRQVEGPPVGALVVIGATAQRAVLGFTAAPFAVTRGDTLFLTARSTETGRVVAETPAATPALPAAARAFARASTRASARPTIQNTLAFELWGSHSETIGAGADPSRSTRDIAMPALRFSSFVTGENSRLRVNLIAQHRSGPASVWDRPTRVRVYEARYDRTAGRAQLTVGRFFSDFDHQSAFWDGASVRVTAARGVSVGAAAGFEPSRGNEGIVFTNPKVAGFIGTRHASERVDLITDFALTQTFPSDASLRRTGADFAMRLRVGRLSFSQDIEAAPPSASGNWEISRLVLRAAMPVGARGYAYSSAVSDRFTPLDTAILLPFSRRERLTSGYSFTTARGGFVDLNASINDPSGAQSGFAAGATISVPKLVGGSTASLHASWFDDGQGSGILASPSAEYRLGAMRIRGGYQYYRINYAAFSTQTHGLDFRLWRPFGERSNAMLQLSERLGHNQRGTTVFSSFEWRF